MKYRRFRLQDQLREEISSIIQQEIKDPGIGFITILDVKMTEDLKYAKVLYSVYGSEEEKQQDGGGPQAGQGLHQTCCSGRRVKLRYHAGAHLRLRYGTGKARPHRRALAERWNRKRWTMFQRIKETVDKGQTFLVATHVDPDGDAVGSAFAACFALTGLGKDAAVYLQDAVPYRYAFLPRPAAVLHELPKNGYDTVLVVDCGRPVPGGRWPRIPEAARAFSSISIITRRTRPSDRSISSTRGPRRPRRYSISS